MDGAALKACSDRVLRSSHWYWDWRNGGRMRLRGKSYLGQGVRRLGGGARRRVGISSCMCTEVRG